MTAGLLAQAMQYHEAGFNVLPCVPRDKKPALTKWKHWQNTPQEKHEVERMFAHHDGNLGIIGGISPNERLYPYFIDCETPEVFEEFSFLAGDTWKAISWQGGHVYFFAEKPIKGKTWNKHGFEVRGVGQYVLAPPSIHPSGIPYRWRENSCAVKVANELPFVALDYAEHVNQTKRLTRLAQRILAKDSEIIGRYPSRSEVDGALVSSLVNAGWEFPQIQELLNGASYDSHYLSLHERHRYKWLLNTYTKNANRGNSPEFEAAIAQVKEYRAWVLGAAPRDITTARTGVTDKKALLAHLEVAEKIGRTEWHLSAREGAELAEMQRQTFAKATKRLIFHQRIEKSRGASATLSGRFMLPSAINEPLTYNAAVCEWFHHCTIQHNTYGVFEHTGLGRQVGDTYQAILLEENPPTIRELAERLKRGPRTIRSHVEKLVQFGLVTVDSARIRTVNVDFQKLGEALGTSDIARKRKAKHAEQRKEHKRFIDQFFPAVAKNSNVKE